MARPDSTLHSEHKAANHRIVGGASIVAKVVRDRIMEALQEDLGFSIGSGYPSDLNTVAALPKLIDEEAIHPTYDGHGQRLNVIDETLPNSTPRREPTGTTLFST